MVPPLFGRVTPLMLGDFSPIMLTSVTSLIILLETLTLSDINIKIFLHFVSNSIIGDVDIIGEV